MGQLRRAPAEACSARVTPASTFKIPHALAALDSGVLSGPEASFSYDGAKVPFAAWRRDHTLASAMQSSVVWVFQRVAEQMGEQREREYLAKLNYGNADANSGLTTFWLGGSLRISPDEQAKFMLRLHEGSLPLSPEAQRSVRDMLVQPWERVENAMGQHPFAAPWPAGTTLRAKTGAGTDADGRSVRWLVGEVEREQRAWIFVSAVVGSAEGAGTGAVPGSAALDLAASGLKQTQVL